MKSSTNMSVNSGAKMKAQKRARHVPVYTYFAQIFSGDLNQRLFELLSFDAFAEEESKRCEDGKYRLVWVLTLEQVKTLFKSVRESSFEIWQSKDQDDLVKATLPLRKKLFKQKVSRGSRIKKASQASAPVAKMKARS